MSRYLPTRLFIFLISFADTKDEAAHAQYQCNPNKSAGDVLFFGSGARFSKLPVITGPVKLFCFLFQKEVSKFLKIIQ